ncbi:hypothetical protein STFE110948_05370 [Streptobacillus felis]
MKYLWVIIGRGYEKIFFVFLLFNNLVSFSEKKYISEENLKKIRLYNEEKVVKNKEVNTEVIKKPVHEVINIQNIEESEVLKLNGTYGVDIKKVGEKYLLMGEKDNISKFKEIVFNLDKIKRQVVVKLNVIDTSFSLFDRLGLNIKLEENKNDNMVGEFLNNKLSLANLLNFGGNKLGLDIESLKQNGDIYINTFPVLKVMNGSEGEIKLTDEYFYVMKDKKMESTEAGIIFRIKPNIITKGYKEYVELDMYSEISSFKGEKFRNKNILNTKILVKNKSCTFVSNVNRESKSIETTSPNIPIFSTIFKKRYKSREKRNVYFEVEVEILNE